MGDLSAIRIKKNALQLLAYEIKHKPKATIGTGSMNDPYMPVESTLQLTRRALQIIASHKFPVHVITKSNVVERDIDILQDIAKTYAAVSLTITCADDTLANKIEPHAPSTSKRFKTMESLARNNIYTGVTLMPLLPFINDDINNMETIIKRAKDAGASYILPLFGVTLRAGSRNYLCQTLEQLVPGIASQYQQVFGQQYMCYSPHYHQLHQTFQELCYKLGLQTEMEKYTRPTIQQLSLF